MLAKKNRLSREQVEFLLKKSQRRRFGNFLVIFKKNKARLNRFCIIIGKKLHLTSVKRARLRRQIYEAVRKNLSAAPADTALDIALGPSSKIPGKTFAEIEKETILILENISKWAKTY